MPKEKHIYIYIHTHLNCMSEILDSFTNIQAEQKYGFVFLSKILRLQLYHYLLTYLLHGAESFLRS